MCKSRKKCKARTVQILYFMKSFSSEILILLYFLYKTHSLFTIFRKIVQFTVSKNIFQIELVKCSKLNYEAFNLIEFE